jgi:hypothetical protein
LTEALQGLALALFAVLPGALYVWSYERQAGTWRVDSPDRVFHFIGASVVLQALAAPATFWAWKHYWNQAALHGETHLPLAAYGILLAYLFVPLVVGSLVGQATKRRFPVIQRIHERTPPRAWDSLFDEPLDSWVRVTTKSGVWLGGPLTEGSWVSTYPSDGDLLLPVAVVDPDTGEWKKDADGRVEVREGSRILVRWNEIEYLQVDPG